MKSMVKTESPMLAEIIEGLRKRPKSIPSKYFYDEKGSELFDQITQLDEYYLARIEMEIMRENIREITSFIGENAVLVELGSGSSQKTRLLLDNLPNLSAYIPVDISDEFLGKVVRKLQGDYPRLTIEPLCADYTKPFDLPPLDQLFKKLLFYYPGSTIGNFKPEYARKFLSRLSEAIDSGGGLLIGVDLKKAKEVLENAYNDKRGVTAAFNKNVLRHINRELGADFDLDHFHHKAIYNEQEGRVEMYLVSEKEQRIQIEGEEIFLAKEEAIHTENSYKYTLEEFEDLTENIFSVEKVWLDEDQLFSIQYLTKKTPK